MIRVFRTDVQNDSDAKKIVNDLLQTYQCLGVNFDLEDEDKILRVEGPFFREDDIVCLLKEYGYTCILLPLELD
jgi:hypothetical protein